MATQDGARLASAADLSAPPVRQFRLARAHHALILMYLAVLLWGTVGPAMQLIASLGPADGPSLGFFRLALALPALLFASWRVIGKLSFAVSRADLVLMLGFGLIMALSSSASSGRSRASAP